MIPVWEVESPPPWVMELGGLVVVDPPEVRPPEPEPVPSLKLEVVHVEFRGDRPPPS